MKKIGVLAFHGDVSEHIAATKTAAAARKETVAITEVRTRHDLQHLEALIIPGGESTTLQMLCEREGMFPAMRRVPAIFGTCAGAILLAKKISNKKIGQRTLELMNITVERNAYGRQADSIERDISTSTGKARATFIRAPKIVRVGKDVQIVAHAGKDIVCCEEQTKRGYYLAATFHPELTTSAFHEYFLERLEKNEK